MSTEQNKANYRRFIEALNNGNVGIIEEIASPNLVIHFLPPGSLPGGESLKQSLASLRAAIPDARITFEDLFAEGDLIAVRCRMTGTHSGPFLNHVTTPVPPTGRRISVDGIDVWRFDGSGRWVECWGGFDRLQLLQQLGVIPATNPNPSEAIPSTLAAPQPR